MQLLQFVVCSRLFGTFFNVVVRIGGFTTIVAVMARIRLSIFFAAANSVFVVIFSDSHEYVFVVCFPNF